MFINIALIFIVLIFALFFIKGRNYRAKVKSEIDLFGKKHKWKVFDDDKSYYCCICEKLLVLSSLNIAFGSRARQCIKCSVIAHDYCLSVHKLKVECKKCCEPEERKNQHHWVKGDCKDDSLCNVCGQFCNNVYDYSIERCLWCRISKHQNCGEDDSICTYGKYSELLLLPYEVKLTQQIKGKAPSAILQPDKKGSIVIFIINRLSGPQFGEEVIEYLYRYFNPLQIIDLLDGELTNLEYFVGLSNLRVVIAGGDGTVGTLTSVVHEKLGNNVAIIPMPLGTGNDLSRALGWGGGLSVMDDLKLYLKQLQKKGKSIYMDRWEITVLQNIDFERVLNDKEYRTQVINSEVGLKIENRKLQLYCGFGLGAKFSYQFNKIREKFPNLFKSRIVNKFMYSQMGALHTFNLVSEKNVINRNVDLYDFDLNKISIEDCENLVFQNTQFWGGGCQDIWNSKEISDLEKRGEYLKWKIQSYSDRVLEALSMNNIIHMGQVQIGLARPNRIAQAKGYIGHFHSNKSTHIHTDGEGFICKGPFTFILKLKDQVLMNLNDCMNEQASLQTEVISVLDWGVENGTINAEQRRVLLNKFTSIK